MAKLTLLDQLSKPQLDALALLVGADFAGAGLRNFLHEVPALPPRFTIREAAAAYLEHRLGVLRAPVPAAA